MRFNDAEYEALTVRAASAGVSVQRFLADGAFASRRPPVSAPAALIAELAGLRRLTRSLSNNINQIARWLNSGGRPDARIAAALDSVQRAMTRLDAVLAWLGAPQQNAPEQRSGQVESPSASAERPCPRGAVAPARRNADPRAPA
jgi:small-conductance mechanosensitive channel